MIITEGSPLWTPARNSLICCCAVVWSGGFDRIGNKCWCKTGEVASSKLLLSATSSIVSKKSLLSVIFVDLSKAYDKVPKSCPYPHIKRNGSAASRARDCGNPANLVALAEIRVDCAPDGMRSSQSWRRLRD